MRRLRLPMRVWIPGLLLVAGIAVQLILLRVEVGRGEARAEQATVDEATLIGTMVSERIDAAYRGERPDDVAGLLGMLAAEPRVRHAALARGDGTILYATEIVNEGKTLDEAGFGRARPALARALATDRLQVEVLRDPPLVVAVAPVRLAARPGELPRLGALVANHELARPLARARVEAIRRALLQGAIFLGASLILYLLLHVAVLRRLSRLRRASERIAGGAYDARSRIGGDDELAALGHAFDRMAADIEARDAALRAGARRIESLLANLDDAVLVVEPDDVIGQVTGGAARALGGGSAGLVGAHLGALVAPDDRPRLAAALADAAAAVGVTVALDVRAVDDGPAAPRFLELRLVAPPDRDAVGGTVVTVRDITERRRLRAEIELRQKMELVSQLAGGVAHDFNNLLSAIMLSAEAMLAHEPPDWPQRPLLTEIYETSIRGGALTRQLLSLGRRDLSKTGPVDVNVVIGELASLLQRLIPSNASLELDLAAAPCWIRGNQGLLEQVLVNLVVNARDAMPDGGHVRIRTRVAGDAAAGPAAVTLEVEDTGVGIDPAVRARIFEPLVSTKAAGTGTGLGLTTVHSIVRDLDGEIGVDSTVGQGTTFRLRFRASPRRRGRPASRRRAAPPPTPAAPSACCTSRTIRRSAPASSGR
ncbi:MAG: HAMP domain-containing protein [Kofleriaceae bacterium]|nr:HAMP domain-containing protein [Kofleriaceae bacterium]